MRKSVYVVTLLMSLSFILAFSARAGNLPDSESPNRSIAQSPNFLTAPPPGFPLLESPLSPNANIIYVDVSASGANDGSTWANAYTDLAQALAQAAEESLIWIAEGTYTPGTERSDSFVLKEDVYLFGGFPTGGGDGTLEARFPAAHETILSGEIGATGSADNSFHVVTGNGISNGSLLDGVSIAHGNANGGGDDADGAGLLIDDSAIYLNNCKIYGNIAADIGPAISAKNDAYANITGCTITGNTNTGQGSALDIRESQLTLVRSTVGYNISAFGVGPLWLVNSQSSLINTVLVNNTNFSPSSGVITVQGGNSTLNNVSVSGHNQTGLAVIEVGAAEGSATVINSIFWNNGATEMKVEGDSTLTVSDSLIKGGFAGGTNIITGDPLFIDAPNGDLRLTIFSPAAAPADLTPCAENDRKDYPRPIAGGCDRGAYETPVRNTICSLPGLAIPDNDPAGVQDSVDVELSGLILDVDVEINATHAFVGDLNAALRHEGTDTVRTILDRPLETFCDGDNINATFDDEGNAPADKTCSATPPALEGRLVPTRPLSVFDGERLKSTWTLSVRDLTTGDTGTLDDWCLMVDWIPALTVTRADDPPPDGCKSGDCSLREAIIAANAEEFSDVITFAVDGPFVLSRPGAGEDLADTGDLDILTSMRIVGNGTNSTIIDGGALDRVFQIINNDNEIEVTFSDLTIQNGLLDPVDGFGYGGGVDINGEGPGSMVKMLRTILRDNHAIASGTGGGIGGAIANFEASLEITDSAIYGNSANYSGAIDNSVAGLSLINTTVYGNTGASETIFMEGNSYLNMFSSTVAANHGNALFVRAIQSGEIANVSLANSIISAPDEHCRVIEENDGSASIISRGNNIAGDDSCNLTEPGDLPNTDPLLGPLADNGGPTPTAALLENSPALDAGSDFGCVLNDQRGLPRLDRDGNGDGGADNNPCDIGAYELQAAFTNTPPVADPQTVNVTRDTSKVITLTGSDADGDPLEYTVTTLSGNGSLTGVFGSPVQLYTPNPGFTGADTFDFIVSDGKTSSAPATVTINVTDIGAPGFNLFLPMVRR